MPAEPQNPAKIDLRTPQGRILACLYLWPPRHSEALLGEEHPLIRLPEIEAQARNEEPIQLRERGRYVYRLEPEPGAPKDLVLIEERGISRNPAASQGSDGGFIEPGDHCGILPLTVARASDPTPLARASVEVRSMKIKYREDYRGMLNHIAEQCASLLLDSRAPTRLRLSSDWRENRAALEQQLEFLRHVLESSTFRAAVDEVLSNPHRHLEDMSEDRSISRPFKACKIFARQIARGGDRIALPEMHPLRRIHPALTSVPARVSNTTRRDYLNTPENRFVKMVLVEFRDFLVEVGALLRHKPVEAAKPENLRLIREVTRLRGTLDSLLGRGFLPGVSRPEMLPLGSPVLQRKGGYRELLYMWLQFHVGAQLTWEGGQDVWRSGARNVATLYEYWLFFQLEAVFREKFECIAPLHSVMVENDAGLSRLKLQRGLELRTPIGGVWSPIAGRKLSAEFHFNRKFRCSNDRKQRGSWTRGVQPDYTISIWPTEFTKAHAEETETMVHIHFDAKYRVDFAKDVFGDGSSDEVIQDRAESSRERPTSAKYADLLKMHAYRDAIRRTGGAYVLYPGNAGDGQLLEEFMGFHEVLPGLGAFAIRPRLDGTAEGKDDLIQFLDDVIEHLSNRTTSRERVSFHFAESYILKETPVQYGSRVLVEWDEMSETKRALPPSEHNVVVAWVQDARQLEWTMKTGLAVAQLGDRLGAWHVPPEFATARHVLLHTQKGRVVEGLLALKDGKPGYKVFTVEDLKAKGYPGSDGGEIYAIFEVHPDPAFDGQRWDGTKLQELMKNFESRRKYREFSTLDHGAAYPRMLSLKELLRAMG